jgi:hypothetical protein|tara:strand:- start:59 stop:304 length:246 start_codon:yes stop_codon:yes gene_type:complete
MTPQEKAIELINIFREFADGTDPETDRYSPKIEKENGKKCALKAVDEIIYSYPTDPFNTLQPTGIVPLNYWREVKNEIEKL